MPLVPFDERPVDVAFSGSLGNSPEEARQRVPTQKLRARRAVFAALDRVAEELPELTVHANRYLSFHWARDRAEGYSPLMASTKVALCPRGSVWETYRFWEALASGCVVVGERLPKRAYYQGAPVLTIDRWSRLPGVLRHLFADRSAMRERAEASLRYWRAHGAPPAVAEVIAARLDPTRSAPRSPSPDDVS